MLKWILKFSVYTLTEETDRKWILKNYNLKSLSLKEDAGPLNFFFIELYNIIVKSIIS